MERNNRKVYVGKVSSAKEYKTIKVEIVTYRKHPLYGKRVIYTKKLTAHDENNEAKIGDTVKKGDVIMIIESMKLMNEVQSEFDGKVTQILVEDGQAVEFDQPIMIIE